MDKRIAAVGFYSALTACLAIVAYGVVQLLQVLGLLAAPFDEMAIFGFSLLIAPPFLLAMLALDHSVLPQARFWTQAGLLFAALYAGFALFTYALQLGVVIPRLADDVTLAMLAIKPHSFLWTTDALAYLCMGVCTLLASLAFLGRHQDRWLRRFLLAHGLITPAIAVAYFYPHFSVAVLFIGSPWLVTAPGATLLMALHFRRRLASGEPLS